HQLVTCFVTMYTCLLASIAEPIAFAYLQLNSLFMPSSFDYVCSVSFVALPLFVRVHLDYFHLSHLILHTSRFLVNFLFFKFKNSIQKLCLLIICLGVFG